MKNNASSVDETKMLARRLEHLGALNLRSGIRLPMGSESAKPSKPKRTAIGPILSEFKVRTIAAGHRPHVPVIFFLCYVYPPIFFIYFSYSNLHPTSLDEVAGLAGDLTRICVVV